MNARDSEKGSVVDFATQLIVMVIIVLFASLWWFETRVDNVEKRLERIETQQANQAEETAIEVGKVIEPFLEDKKSWQQSEPLLREYLDQ